MSGRPPHTRQIILDVAESLILTRGYNGFSYKDISDVIGIKKASIHHHFPSKEDLGAAFVESYIHRFETWCEDISHQTPAQKLESLLKMFKHVSNNAEKICPMGMLTAEYPTLPPKVQKVLRMLLGDMDLWLVEVLSQGQTEGYLKPSPEAPIMAKVIINALSASLKTARVFNDVHQLEQVFNAITSLIRCPEQEIPAPQ